MKPLSRQERAGALVLAAAVIAVIGGMLIVRQYRAGAVSDSTPVTIVYPDSSADSGSYADYEDGKYERKGRRGKGGRKSSRSGKRKRSHSARSRSKENGPDAYVTRDPLSDTIELQMESDRFVR